MPTQDFKGTINGNTITAGTGTLTMAAGKTLTVSESATITETPPLNANVFKGDGTAGRVIRAINLNVENATDAAKVKCKTASMWSGDVNAYQDNIGKDAVDTGVFNLSVSGAIIKLLNTGISGDCVAVLSATITYNNSTVAANVNPYVDGGIALAFANPTSGAAVDLTTLVDSGYVQVTVIYITSA